MHVITCPVKLLEIGYIFIGSKVFAFRQNFDSGLELVSNLFDSL